MRSREPPNSSRTRSAMTTRNSLGASPSWRARAEPAADAARHVNSRSSQQGAHRRTADPCLDDFEDEYPGATALATECYANVIRAGDLLVGLHSRQMLDDYRLSQSALQILAIIEGARGPLEPTVIARDSSSPRAR